MSQQIDDGGSAFPNPIEWDPNGQVVSKGSHGMSLRDWFAGQALAGNLAYPHNELSPGGAAIMAYKYADAMLAARKGGQP